VDFDLRSIKDWLMDEIMYMGADVNHDAPEDTREEPVSCAAVGFSKQYIM